MADDFKYSVIKHTSQNSDPVEVCQVDHTNGLRWFAFESSLNWDKDGDPMSYGLNNSSTSPGNTQHGIVQHEKTLAYAGDPWTECQWHLDNQTESSSQHLFRWAAIMSAQSDPPGYKRDTRPFLESRVKQERDDDGNLVPLGAKEPGFFPVIQKLPNAGYFISTTSESTGLGTDQYDQREYVDATKISYMAHAKWWKKHDVLLGDFGFAYFPYTGKYSGFVFADTGVGKVGECSTKFFDNTWPGQNPNGVNTNKAIFIVFPASGRTIRRQDKYASDSVVQEQAKQNMLKLNLIDDILPFVEFLAFGASKTAFDRFRAGKSPEKVTSDADARLIGTAGILDKVGVTWSGL